MSAQFDKEAEIARRARAGSAQLDLEEGDSIQAAIGLGDRLLMISKRRTYSIRPPNLVDPDVTHEHVPWEQVLVLPFGVSDDVVARTLIHIDRNAKAAGFPQELVEELQSVTFNLLMSIANMAIVRNRACSEVNAIIADLEEGIELIFSRPPKKSIRQAPSLALEFRTLIFESKRVLNYCTELFEVLLGKSVQPGHFHKLLQWAEKKYGRDHQITELLHKSQPWISRAIDFRNMVEHPKKDSQIEIVNFSMAPSGEVQVPHFRVLDPRYADYPPMDVRDLLSAFLESTITLFEQISACLLVHSQKSRFLAAIEPIPDGEIDDTCPVRYRPRFSFSDLVDRQA